MQSKASRQALKLALIYIIAAGGWILFSDEILRRLVRDPDARTWISIYKGWAFVLVTGGLLHLTVRRLLRNWEREAEQRREIMEKLRKSEEQLRLVLDASEDGLWDWNLKTGIAYLSPRYCEMTGFAVGEVVADIEFLKRLVHPEDWPGVQAAVNENMAGKSIQSVIEYRMITKDGAQKWTWVRGKVVERTPDGTPLRMVGTISDITERKQAQQKLRESDERYRQLFELESDALFLVDAETHNFLEVNQSAQQLYGYSREEFLKMRAEEISAEPEKTRETEGAGSVFVPLRWHRKKNGERFAVEITASVIQHQGRRMELTAIRDITARQQAMDRLREATTQLLEAQRIANLGSYVLDVSTGQWTCSQVMDELFGIADVGFTKDLAGWLEIVHPDDRAELWHYWSEQVLKRKVAFDRIYRVVRRNDRQERTVHGLGKLILDDAGQVVKMVGIIQDITERKQAELALRESEENYRSLFESSRDAIMTLAPDTGRFTSGNPATLEIFRAKNQAEFFKCSLMDLSPERQPDGCLSAEKARAMIDTAMREGSHFFEWTHRRMNGEEFFADVLLTRMERGGKPVITATVRDITGRKQQTNELLQKTAFLEALVHSSTDGILVVDNQSRKVFQNQRMTKLWRIPPEIASNPDDRIQHQFARDQTKDPAGFEEKTRQLVASLDAFAHDEIELKNGSVLERHTSLVKDADGNSYGRVWFFHDITERKQAERRIVEATNYAQTLLAASPIGIITYRADGQTVSANAAAARLVGITVENLKEQNFRELESWKNSKLLEQAELALATGQEQLFEDLTVSSYGNALWLLARFVPFRYEGNPHLLLLMQDITERKRAEEQVQVQFSALTAAANAIVITDGEGKIEWVNPAFTKLTGYSAEEAIGGNPRVLKSGRHSPGFYANLWATIITGNVWHGEIINQRKDGKLYTEEMTITPVRGADGQFAHFVAIKQDVTERRGLELRLQQAQKMEAIGTLAGGIAHDFNNILAAIFGYGYLLKQDTLEHPAREYVGEILKAANRAKDLVQQILTFSRQREFDRQIIQLQTVVKEAMKFLRASMPASIKIETNFAPDASAVLADPTQIYQVVTNLATNALHAMEDRPGQLTVRLEPFQPDEAFIRLHPELKPIPYARLTFADTGHGIDAGTLKRIFEPFFTTKPIGKGTGLGLSVVHGILQAHEGAITVESEVGRGTTFALYFPGRTKGATVAEAGAKNAPGGRGQKILLLDDERALTAVMQSLLARLNYQATTSNSARNAIGLCRENPARFDLVITDLTMPEMNGLEVARQIRAIRPDMPVILISGFSVELSREDLTAAGICESLKKPVGMNQLAEAVQGALMNNGRCLPPARQPS